VADLKTTELGYRMAAGMGGAILRQGADLIVIGDPRAVSQAERRRVNEVFHSTIYSWLNDTRCGAIVIITQRLHDDLHERPGRHDPRGARRAVGNAPPRARAATPASEGEHVREHDRCRARSVRIS